MESICLPRTRKCRQAYSSDAGKRILKFHLPSHDQTLFPDLVEGAQRVICIFKKEILLEFSFHMDGYLDVEASSDLVQYYL